MQKNNMIADQKAMIYGILILPAGLSVNSWLIPPGIFVPALLRDCCFSKG